MYMTLPINLGFPRIGAQRELKRALESFWTNKSDEVALQKTARDLRLRHWKDQQDRGITGIPGNDFSFYDQVLDTAVMVGAIPDRYAPLGKKIKDKNGNETFSLKTYFAMARGHQDNEIDVPAMEMTKWFDTNYHYIVPEFTEYSKFELVSTKVIDEFLEAKEAGIHTRPVILGPVSFLLLGKMVEDKGDSQGRSDEELLTVELIDRLVPVYNRILTRLKELGADWVQLDEPALVLDLSDKARDAFKKAYAVLANSKNPQILVATYFGSLGDNLELAAALPVAGLHIDLVRAPEQLDNVLGKLSEDKVLSAGVVDGRNVWKTDLDAAFKTLKKIAGARGSEKLWVSPSCSLLHSPVDLSFETKLDSEVRSWLAFASEKLIEISELAAAVDTGNTDGAAFIESRRSVASRKNSKRVHNAEVEKRTVAVTDEMRTRDNKFAIRKEAQKALDLPLLPTTTIGSFPQTQQVRAARAEFKAGKRTLDQYNQFLREETERTIRIQEQIGLDVLVHGEFERNDMVEYFGEQLSGFVFTQNGWVQSYGSRCVKPPIIFGDVSRPKAMTVEWSSFAQSLTRRPMKGMLTGPVTILQWSFVRDDQPRSLTCDQIALAIRDEVVDLEKAGIKVIQIDEPAIREGLPLRKADWKEYLKWAVDAFRLSASGVQDATQIHTHMCYSEFNEIIDSVAAMDADVVSMETSRSNMELLDAFRQFNYPNDIGPGVYDIHSPRVPSDDEILNLLRKAVQVIDADQIWVNPDCGLKTRSWEEVTPALETMVRGARALREELVPSPAGGG